MEETGRAVNDMCSERQWSVSYPLRLWQAGSGGKLGWRASLENPQTGERRGFVSLVDLLMFLEEYRPVGRNRSGRLEDTRGA